MSIFSGIYKDVKEEVRKILPGKLPILRGIAILILIIALGEAVTGFKIFSYLSNDHQQIVIDLFNDSTFKSISIFYAWIFYIYWILVVVINVLNNFFIEKKLWKEPGKYFSEGEIEKLKEQIESWYLLYISFFLLFTIGLPDLDFIFHISSGLGVFTLSTIANVGFTLVICYELLTGLFISNYKVKSQKYMDRKRELEKEEVKRDIAIRAWKASNYWINKTTENREKMLAMIKSELEIVNNDLLIDDIFYQLERDERRRVQEQDESAKMNKSLSEYNK